VTIEAIAPTQYHPPMYAKFFGLTAEPFSIAPDPHYLFMSERHREALAHLLYGASGGGGFVLLTGEIGAGKTTVCRCFLEQIPKRCNVAYIFNPKLTVPELLQSVCDEFRIPYPAVAQGQAPLSVKDYLDPINQFLLRTHAIGCNNILIVDEAQHLSVEVLEQLRLLTNLETNERKLLQVILIGQPELRGILARPELEQLAQRVIARFHLEALSELETSRYIRHRLNVAGMTQLRPFDTKVRERIHVLTRGVPRRINLLCDRAMLGAYAAGKTEIDVAMINRAASEVFALQALGAQAAVPLWRKQAGAWAIGLGLLAGAGLVGAIAWGIQGGWARPAQAPKLTAAPVPASAPLPANAPLAAASATNPASADVKLLVRDEDQAWRELAPLWQLSPPQGKPCAAFEAQQVQCFKAQVTLALVRQLDRPGLLTLHDDKGKVFYAVLQGVGAQSVSVGLGGVSRTMSVSTLAQLWQGEFSTLWRAPSGYRAPLAKGQTSFVVDALAQQLAKVLGEPPLPESPVFDDKLKARVAVFQLSQGLTPDGVAGPTTFMQLRNVVAPDEPRLQNLQTEPSGSKN
jgi:general secretion pathway protein A